MQPSAENASRPSWMGDLKGLSRAELLQVYFLLCQRLPPEISYMTLESGKLCTRTLNFKNAVRRTAREDDEVVYLNCRVSSEMLREGIQVKAIRFKIVSSDQGWSWDEQNHGTYDGAFSWLEARIFRPSPGYTGKDVPGTGTVEESTVVVQRNVHAKRQPTEHTVVWERGDLVEGRFAFIDALRTDDIIQLMPKAEYSGWSCTVHKASVTIVSEIQI